MQIRRATDDDIDGLVALEREAFGNGPYQEHQFGARQFGYYVNKPEAIVLVSAAGTRLLGNVIATAGTRSRAHIGRILNLAVAPAARGRGIGGKLMDAALEWLQHRGCRKAVLEVACVAEPARRLFEHHGFAGARRLPDHYGPENDGLRMTRNL